MDTATCPVCADPIIYAKGFCKFHYDRQYRGADLYAPRRLKSPNGTDVYDKVMALSVWDGDCFVFTRACDENGYGRIGIPGVRHRSMLAHRAVMEHHFGKSKLFVLHSCDNPPCVRIEHLRYGNQVANMSDAITRGRMKGRSLSDEAVTAILTDTRRQVIIAAEYGIDPSHVSKIKSGQRRRQHLSTR